MEDNSHVEQQQIPSSEGTQAPVTASTDMQIENPNVNPITEKELETVLKKSQELVQKNNFEEALSLLTEAHKSTVKSFGESSYESAVVHFELGSILLQKVENSRDVFGDVIKVNNKEEQAQEDRETGRIPEQETTQNATTKIVPETAPKEKEMEITDKKDLVEIAEEKDEEEENMIQEPEPENQAGANKEDDADDLQVAWEHLEVSRLGFEKLLQNYGAEPQEEELIKISKIKKYLSSVLLRLGDANCCWDNFPAALQEYGKCLEIRKAVEDNFFSRQLAEIYYVTGTAHLYQNLENCDDLALNSFNKARLILENLLHKYMDSSSVKDPEDFFNHSVFMSREYFKSSPFETEKAKEIKEILKELYDKIEDTKEQKKERAKVAQELQKAKQLSEAADKLESTFSKPVLGAQQGTTTSGTTNPPPKVLHLGTLGNAKKRNRETMENMSKPQEVKTINDKTNLGEMVPEVDKSLQNPNLSGKATKVDESGHTEKMTKMA